MRVRLARGGRGWRRRRRWTKDITYTSEWGGLCILLERRICRDISNKWTTRSPTHIAPFFGVNRLDLFAAFGEITNAQCDQIGWFFGILGNNFFCKSSPNVWILFGQLWNPSLFKVNLMGYFLGNVCKNLGYFLFQHWVNKAGGSADSLFL